MQPLQLLSLLPLTLCNAFCSVADHTGMLTVLVVHVAGLHLLSLCARNSLLEVLQLGHVLNKCACVLTMQGFSLRQCMPPQEELWTTLLTVSSVWCRQTADTAGSQLYDRFTVNTLQFACCTSQQMECPMANVQQPMLLAMQRSGRWQLSRHSHLWSWQGIVTKAGMDEDAWIQICGSG